MSAATAVAMLLASVYKMLWQARRMACWAVLEALSRVTPIRQSIMSPPARMARFTSIQLVLPMAESVITVPVKPHSWRSTLVSRAWQAPAQVSPM